MNMILGSKKSRSYRGMEFSVDCKDEEVNGKLCRRADLLLLGAGIGQAQPHDGSYPHNGVGLLDKIVQQSICRVILMLHPTIKDSHR